MRASGNQGDPANLALLDPIWWVRIVCASCDMVSERLGDGARSSVTSYKDECRHRGGPLAPRTASKARYRGDGDPVPEASGLDEWVSKARTSLHRR